MCSSQGRLQDAGCGKIYAPATITLITCTENNLNAFKKPQHILVDAGGLHDTPEDLNRWLEPFGINALDIRRVVITHNHSDHTGLLSELKNATIFAPDSTYNSAKPPITDLGHIYSAALEDAAYLNSPDVAVIKTGGHGSSVDQSVLAETDEGRVLIAGDLYLNEEEFRNPHKFLWPPDNNKIIDDSRRRVIEEIKPRKIIPGHGAPFYV